MVRLLVVDGDRESNRILRALLPDEFAVVEYTQGVLAVDKVREHDPDVVLLAAELHDAPSQAILAAITDLPVAPPVVLIASCADAPIVAKAIRAGAFSYLSKPLRREHLLTVVGEAIVESTHRRMADSLVSHPAIAAIIGESPVMLRLKEQVAKYGTTDSSVLLLGESGTGKDLVAQAIHRVSARQDGPFVAVNCGAIPLAIFESEMFGAERGAYTGAVSRPGSFEQANRGTLFLDEIGEMEPHAQVKILRALEDGSIMRVGGVRPTTTDTRVVAATNRNLRKALEEGAFRQDLYYRLNLLSLRVPALRDRVEDIPLLVDHFLRSEFPGKSMSTSAVRKLLSHDWPGNVRELRNVVGRAGYLTEGRRITAAEVVLV